MKKFIIAVVFCLLLAFVTQSNAQDCSNERCRPVAKLASKMKQAEVFKFDLSIKCGKKWDALRPKNWFKRFKSWRCCK